MAVLESPKVMSDLLKWEVESLYVRTSGKLKNAEVGATAAISNPVGIPVRNNAGTWELVVDGDEAETDGIVIQGPKIEALAAGASTENDYLILKRGPAAINKQAIATADHADSAFDVDAIVTALEGLSPPIAVLDEPAETETHTT